MERLHEGQQATVRTDFGETKPFLIGKGVRQGCILSPYLYNLYSEIIMRNAGLDKMEIGLRIGGRLVNNVRFADDTTLISTAKSGLIQLLRSVKQESEKYGLYLNLGKTRVMTTGNMDEFIINGEKIEQVESFIFLGSNVNKVADCGQEIQRRLTLGRTAMTNLTKIWKCRDVRLTTKRRIVQTLVFPVVLYGCKLWTIRKVERKRLMLLNYGAGIGCCVFHGLTKLPTRCSRCSTAGGTSDVIGSNVSTTEVKILWPCCAS